MTISISPVTNTQSFGTWLQRTNDIIYIIGANAVTADSTTTGSITTGNSFVNGIFGANTLYVTRITAGNIWSNGALVTITSNAYSNAYITVGNGTVNSAYIGWSNVNQTVFEGNVNYNSYTGIMHNNTSNGTNASADVFLFNDEPSALSYFNIGINSTNYSNSLFSITDPSGSYIIASNSSLVIGTDTAKPIKFFANGTTANVEVMRITPAGTVGVGTTTPSGKFQVVGNTFLSGNTTVTGTLTVTANVTVGGVTLLNNTLNVNAAANMYSTANVANTLGVVGAVTFSNTLNVTGNVTLSNTVSVTGNVSFSNTLSVSGLSTLANVNVNVANVANLNSSDTIRVGISNATSIGFLANTTTILVGNTANSTIVTGNTITTNTIQTHFLSVTGLISGAFSATGSIIPAVNNAVILGTSSNVFTTAWATNVYSNAISSFSGSLTVVSNTTFNGIINVNNNKQISTGVFNYTNNSIATVDSYSAATFRSAEYTVQATETATGSYHFTKLLVTHDGSTGYVTEYGTINNNGNMLTFTCDINAGNVRLRGAPTSSNASLSMAVKFTRDAITV